MLGNPKMVKNHRSGDQQTGFQRAEKKKNRARQGSKTRLKGVNSNVFVITGHKETKHILCCVVETECGL